MALSQFRAGLQCMSKRAACVVFGGIRTAASKVQFSPSLPPDHTRTPPASEPSTLSKRDRKVHTPKPPPSLKPHSGGATQERSPSFAEHKRPPISNSLPKKATRQPTPTAARLHRESMKRSFPEGWCPPRKLSRQAMDGLRALHKHDPRTFSTQMLAKKFHISPEAVRRILRSQWEPSSERMVRLSQRESWERRAWIDARREAEREDYYKTSAGKRTNRRRTRG